MGGVAARSDRCGVMSGPDMESPPALGAEGQAIAVGASVSRDYTIDATRAILQTTVSPLIDIINLIDGGDIAGEPEHGL